VFSAATNNATAAGKLSFHRCTTVAVATYAATAACELLSPHCSTVDAAAATHDATDTDQWATLQKSASMVKYLRQELREIKTKEYGWIAANTTLETSTTKLTKDLCHCQLTSEALLARASGADKLREQFLKIKDENIKLNQALDHKASRDGEGETYQRITRSLTLHHHVSYWLPGCGKWKEIAKVIWRLTHLKKNLIRLSMIYVRNKLYNAKAIARVMDLNHGLNLTGLEAFHKIDNLPKWAHGFIMSSSAVKTVFRKVKRVMTSEITTKQTQVTIDEDGDAHIINGVELNIEALFVYLIKHWDLGEIAKKRNVEIAITIDAAEIDNETNHITVGFKLCDKATRCPVTKMLIFSDLCNLQSDKWCFPIKMLLAKDNNETCIRHFKDVFDFCQRLRTVALPERGWLPFLVAEPQDMKPIQLSVGRAGASKRNYLFCHCCPCSSDDLAVPRENPCTSCAALSEPVLKKRQGCSHHRVCEQTYIRETMFKHNMLVFVRYGPVEQDDPEGTRLLPSMTCFYDAFERLDSKQRKLKKDENTYWKLYSNLEMALSRTIGQSDETSKHFVVNNLPPVSDKE
jgi:hypothetical protein